jgi:hypothetical protein
MKSYIVEFTHRVTGDTFIKFGHTKYSDVMKRFEFSPEQYQDYVIKVLASMKHSTLEEAESVESEFLDKYPKNLSLPRNFSGITEIYKPEDEQERATILREFYILKASYKKKSTIMPWPMYNHTDDINGITPVSNFVPQKLIGEENDKIITDAAGADNPLAR